ncbi:MAG: hypothetical protein O3B01_23265 [Planctomycetota bacterium]|nr:hypothetical protein [Planctomycetota bacterium]MDA1141492.1 hypothetical protein [Planctomycetota bacterium]
MAMLKCPVCGAKFRGTTECSRCGADLSPLMRLATRAWLVRQQAIDALLLGNPQLAEQLAAEAMSNRSSPENLALEVLAGAYSSLSAQGSI